MFPDSFKIQAKNLRLKRPPDWREREKKGGGDLEGGGKGEEGGLDLTFCPIMDFSIMGEST